MRIVGAIFCLFGIIVSWVLEAELLQDLQEPESPAYFNKVWLINFN